MNDTVVQTNHLSYRGRVLSIADLPEVADLERITQLDPWTRDQVLAVAPLLECGEYSGAVLLQAEQILAYVLVRFILDECEILGVGVMPDQQGKGLGQQLLHTLFDTLPPTVQTIHLEVRVSNLPAQKLDARLGFIEVGQRKGYYAALKSDGSATREDAVLMSKKVNQAI